MELNGLTGKNIKRVSVFLSAACLFIIVDHVFLLGFMGNMELQNAYNYFLMAAYIPLAFLLSPVNKGGRLVRKILLGADIVLSIMVFCICTYFAYNGYNMLTKGWAASAPQSALILSTILWVAILESSRRSGGLALAIVAAVFSIYPLFAEYMPGLLRGVGFTLDKTIAYHMMSPDSAVGVPMTVVGNILVGYMIFGVALMVSGAGDFFLDVSYSLMGHARGGVAKVAVLASAFFGSLSGSAVSNVVSTGTFTIPMMIKSGYRPYFAAAVEACASNGGQLMPPVMGAVAFLMASLLNLPYLTIAIAATLPSLLYYAGLLIQVDGYAANNGLEGLPRADLPSFKKVMREGWYYCFAMALLVILLFFEMEAEAPYYTSIFLIIIANIRRKTRMNAERVADVFQRLSQLMSQIVPTLAAVGMIMGALSMTGVAHAFPSELVRLAGGNLTFLLLLGAVSSFILGMGMTPIAVYVFLAVILAPALIEMGLFPLAVHLFILYWGILSFITPPVCIAVYPAASIAGASSMQTGIAAVKLGAVSFIIPFFFVLEPALILQGNWFEIIHAVITAFIGVFLLASALEGYMLGLGSLRRKGLRRWGRPLSFVVRTGLFISGLFLALPGGHSDAIGVLAALAMITIFWLFKKPIPRLDVLPAPLEQENRA